jgi:general transcription factor 3C polypeptide 3 (transcription factor C subunit 4)
MKRYILLTSSYHLLALIGPNGKTSNFHILLQIGLCHRNLSNFDSAIEVYQIGKALWTTGFHHRLTEVHPAAIAADPSNTDVKMKLAEIYEMTNQSRKALELVQEGA